jgi:hypothetical protein
MAVRSFRLPDDLDRTLSDRAIQTDRSVSYVIVKALEKELATEDGSGEDARVSPTVLPASSRASEALEGAPHARREGTPSRSPGSGEPRESATRQPVATELVRAPETSAAPSVTVAQTTESPGAAREPQEAMMWCPDCNLTPTSPKILDEGKCYSCRRKLVPK